MKRAEMFDLILDSEEWYEDAKDDAQEAFRSEGSGSASVSFKRLMMVEIFKGNSIMRPVPLGTRMPEYGLLVN